MRDSDRDRNVIGHILRYCWQIEIAHDDFGCSRVRFDQSTTYQNAISMCILQIGELVNHLSNDFKDHHTEIPWHKIRVCAIMLPMNMALSIWTWFGRWRLKASLICDAFAAKPLINNQHLWKMDNWQWGCTPFIPHS